MGKLQKIMGMIFIGVFVASCGNVESTPIVDSTITPDLLPPTASITPSPIPSLTPFPTNTSTITPEPGTPLGCNIVNEDGEMFVVSYIEFYAIGPSTKVLDQVVADNFPEWSSYRQNVSWTSESISLGEAVHNGSWDETSHGINSSVALVTLGELYNWELPYDRDLYSETKVISREIFILGFEWNKPGNEQLKEKYPEISNESTYALYVFFDYDINKLQSWCETYQLLFGVSSLDR